MGIVLGAENKNTCPLLLGPAGEPGTTAGPEGCSSFREFTKKVSIDSVRDKKE